MSEPASDSPRDGEEEHPLVLLLRRLEARDPLAAQELHGIVSQQVERYVAKRLTAKDRKVADEEDITQSALKSVMLGAQQGKFRQIQTDNRFWGLLYEIAKRKLSNHVRDLHALKRGADQTKSEAELQCPDAESSANFAIANIAGSSPDPESEFFGVESMEELVKSLDDELLESILILRLDGHTNKEIAELVGTSLATVERKMSRIRGVWKNLYPPDEPPNQPPASADEAETPPQE